jgi:endonuclease/exonuclease/phosphatase family metal-dependent hydrolase
MKPSGLIHFAAVGMNIITTLLFITASFSDSVSPEKSTFFSYLGLLFPFFLMANICFLIYWFIRRKWIILFVAVCSILICWKPVSHYMPIHPCRTAAPRKNTIKMLTFNVMGFGYRNHTAAKPNPIIQYIAGSGADIVCMQEYMVSTSDNYLTQAKISKALNMYPYYNYMPLVHYDKYSVGLAVFSKHPVVSARKVRYDSSFNGSVTYEIHANGKKIMIVNNHLESFKLTMEDRSKYAEFIKNINADTFDGLRETVQRKLGSAFLIRAEQADIVAEEISRLKGDYTVVCGDFNDTPISYAHRTIQGDLLVDSFVESGNGVGITYNQNFFWFRIDHILHSPNMKSYRATVDKVGLSDHYPLWCYLEMN